METLEQVIERNLSDFALLGIHFNPSRYVMNETFTIESSEINLFADRNYCVILEMQSVKKTPLCNLQDPGAAEIFLKRLKEYKIKLEDLKIPQ